MKFIKKIVFSNNSNIQKQYLLLQAQAFLLNRGVIECIFIAIIDFFSNSQARGSSMYRNCPSLYLSITKLPYSTDICHVFFSFYYCSLHVHLKFTCGALPAQLNTWIIKINSISFLYCQFSRTRMGFREILGNEEREISHLKGIGILAGQGG